MEKRLDDSANPLTMEELRAYLNLCYERLGLRKKDDDDVDHDKKLASCSKFKENAVNVARLDKRRTVVRVVLMERVLLI